MGLIDSEGLSPKAVMAAMHLDEEKREQLQRIVAAGMKVMFSEQTHGMVQKQLQGPGPIEEKVGQGVAGVLGILWQESKGALNPMLIIPGGLVLVAHAADFLAQTGQPMTPQQIGAAQEILVNEILKVSKLNPDRIAEQGAQAQQSQTPEVA